MCVRPETFIVINPPQGGRLLDTNPPTGGAIIRPPCRGFNPCWEGLKGGHRSDRIQCTILEVLFTKRMFWCILIQSVSVV